MSAAIGHGELAGGSTHITGVVFAQEAKIKLTHVPYKGALTADRA